MNVLIADKANKVRSAIGLLLYQQPRITATYEAEDAAATLDIATHYTFEIILLDWRLSDKAHPQFIEKLQALQPQAAIIALSSCPDDRQSALRAGVCAYVSKGDPPEYLLSAIYTCMPMNEKPILPQTLPASQPIAPHYYPAPVK